MLRLRRPVEPSRRRRRSVVAGRRRRLGSAVAHPVDPAEGEGLVADVELLQPGQAGPDDHVALGAGLERAALARGRARPRAWSWHRSAWRRAGRRPCRRSPARPAARDPPAPPICPPRPAQGNPRLYAPGSRPAATGTLRPRARPLGSVGPRVRRALDSGPWPCPFRPPPASGAGRSLPSPDRSGPGPRPWARSATAASTGSPFIRGLPAASPSTGCRCGSCARPAGRCPSTGPPGARAASSTPSPSPSWWPSSPSSRSPLRHRRRHPLLRHRRAGGRHRVRRRRRPGHRAGGGRPVPLARRTCSACAPSSRRPTRPTSSRRCGSWPEQLEVPLIGFAGGPFTVASYLVEGGPSRTSPGSRP